MHIKTYFKSYNFSSNMAFHYGPHGPDVPPPSMYATGRDNARYSFVSGIERCFFSHYSFALYLYIIKTSLHLVSIGSVSLKREMHCLWNLLQ